MFGWFKRYKVLIIILVFVAVVGIPLLIHWLFKIYPSNPFWIAEWTAGELLGYYGSVLAFIGTIILGALALYQNNALQIESNKRAKLLEQRELEEKMPRFFAESKLSNGHCTNLRFEIKNTSENIANEIIVYGIRVLKPDDSVFWETDRIFQFATLPANTSIEIQLDNPSIVEANYVFSVGLKCKDKLNGSHDYIAKGVCEGIDSHPKFKITELS